MINHGSELFSIQTRQKADVTVNPASLTPLGVGETFTSAVFATSGYQAVCILGISDQPFVVRVVESGSVDGPFIQTATVSSSVDAATGAQKATLRLSPVGLFMKVLVDNQGARQRIFQLGVLGVPMGGSAAGGGGGSGNVSGSGTPGYLAQWATPSTLTNGPIRQTAGGEVEILMGAQVAVRVDSTFGLRVGTGQGLGHIVLDQVAADPPAEANAGVLYDKAVAGVDQLFFRNGTAIYQLTPTGTPSLILVGTEVLAADTDTWTPVPFTGLDGDADGFYVIRGTIISGDNASGNFHLRINGGEANLSSSFVVQTSVALTPVGTAYGIMGAGFTIGTVCTVNLDLYARSGLNRSGTGSAVRAIGVLDQAFIPIVIKYADAVTKITSLGLFNDGGGGAGFKAGSVLSLWKMPY